MSLFGSGGWPAGLIGYGADELTGLLIFEVNTTRSKSLVEEQAVYLGIPQSMLSITVRGQVKLNDPPVQTYSEPGIKLTLEIPESVAIGEQATFQIALENTSNRMIDVEISSPPSVDVVVLTIDGKQLWRHEPALLVGTGRALVLDAGGISRFAVPWDLSDDDGFPLPPGQYLVRGFARISENGLGRYVPIELATAAIPFTLSAAP